MDREDRRPTPRKRELRPGKYPHKRIKRVVDVREGEVCEVFAIKDICLDLAAVDPEWRLAIVVAYYSGMLLSDVVGLRWHNVGKHSLHYLDRDRKRPPGMTGRLTDIPIHPELALYLTPVRGRRNMPLCPRLGSATIEGIEKEFDQLLRDAKLAQVIQHIRVGDFSHVLQSFEPGEKR